VDNKVIIAALDCTGHGVPGAFMTLLANSLLNQLVIENRINSPNIMLSALDSKIKQALHQQNGVKSTIGDGMDMAVCMIDLDSLEVCYSGARMPIYYTNDGYLQQLEGNRHSLGGTDHTEKTFTNKFMQLKRGEMLYLASDGLQDQFGGSLDRKFMRKKFRHMLAGIQHLPTPDQHKNVEAIYYEWKGNLPQTDDIMVVGIRL
jgi:serine phosphatase RsbU (regulator of sigma subunit)